MQIVAPMIALLMVSTAVMIETVGESQANFKESINMTNNTEIIEMASAGLSIARSELVKDTNWCDGENADKNKGIYVDADGDGNADEKVYELYSSEFSKNYVNEELNAGKLSIYLKDLKDCQKKMVLAKAEIDGQSKIITTVFSATPSTNQMPIVTTMVGSFARGGSVCTYLEDENGVDTSGITNPNLSVMFDKKVRWLNVGFETTDNPTGENAKNIRIYADMEDGDISIGGYKLFDEVYSTGDIILRNDAHVGYAEANGIVDIGDKVCTPTYETRTVMKEVCQEKWLDKEVCELRNVNEPICTTESVNNPICNMIPTKVGENCSMVPTKTGENCVTNMVPDGTQTCVDKVVQDGETCTTESVKVGETCSTASETYQVCHTEEQVTSTRDYKIKKWRRCDSGDTDNGLICTKYKNNGSCKQWRRSCTEEIKENVDVCEDKTRDVTTCVDDMEEQTNCVPKWKTVPECTDNLESVETCTDIIEDVEVCNDIMEDKEVCNDNWVDVETCVDNYVEKNVCWNEPVKEVVCTDEPFEEQVQVGESCRGRNGSYDSAKENANYEHPEFAEELDDLTIDTAMTNGGDITCGNSGNGGNGGITVPAGVFSSGIGGAGNSHSYLDITNNTVFIKGADTFDIGYIRDGDTCDSPWWKAPVCSACESKECKESGNNGSAMVFPEKPTDNILDSGSWWKENKTFNGGEYIYGSLNIGDSNLDFNSGANIVYVKGNLTFNNKTTVNIANGAKVIFVVYGNLNVTNSTKLNFNDNVAKLMIMTTGTMNFNSQVNVNGYFYSKGKIHVTNNTNIKGGIVSESYVTMTSNVNFDADGSGIGTIFIPPKDENPMEITLEPNIQYDKINIMDGCVVNMNEAGTYYANDFTVDDGDMTLNANDDIEFAITNYENSSGGNLEINLPNNNSSFVMVTDTTYISNDSTHHCDYVSKCMIDTNRAEITNGANVVSTIVARDKIHTASNNSNGGCNIKSQNEAEWNTCMDNLMTALKNDQYNSTVGKQPIIVGNIISEYFASTNARLCNVVDNNGDVQMHGSALNLSANGNPVFGSISERIVNRILTAICTDDLATCVANAETDFEAVKYP